MNIGVFLNVADLSIAFDRWNSSVPLGINLLNVRKLSVSLSQVNPPDRRVLASLKTLLRQTPNIQSLELSGIFIGHENPAFFKGCCRAVVLYADPSKLRHLRMPVFDIDDVRMLLSSFRDVVNIKFDLRGRAGISEQTVTYLKTLTKEYSCVTNGASMFIKKGQKTNDS
jgi:hypothetical protein